MDRVTVRMATRADREAAARLVKRARRVFLSWEAINMKGLPETPAFWAAWAGRRFLGFLFCLYRRPSGAWLGGVGLADTWVIESALKALLPPAMETLAREGIPRLNFMGNERWLLEPLQRSWGFKFRTSIVTYMKRGGEIPLQGNREVEIRRALPEDVPAIEEVDRQAFAPIWRYDARTFAELIGEMSSFTLALLLSLIHI